MAVNDVELWTALPAGTLSERELVIQLEALGREVLPDRWPFLGHAHVGRLLDHPSPTVRAAAVRCFAGATGTTAWPRLVRACHDQDAAVRHAGFQALQVSARQDPLRWVHVLLGSDRDLIPEALRHLPHGFPRELLFPLLAEERHRDAVLRAIGTLSIPRYAAHLLAAVRMGHLTRAAGQAAIEAMPWEYDTPAILEALIPDGSWPEEPFLEQLAADPRLESLRLLVEEPALADPALDELLHLCWAPDGGQQGGDALLRVLGYLTTSDPAIGWMARLGAGLTRQGVRHGVWTAERIAIIAAVFPMILEAPELPPDALDPALALMRPMRTAAAPDWWQASVRRLLEGPIFRSASGGHHLERLAGFPLPWSPWAGPDAAPVDTLRASLAGDPAGAVQLLYRARDWADTDRAGIIELVDAAWGQDLASSLAQLAFEAPMGAMAVRDWLGEGRRAEVLEIILDRLGDCPGAIRHRELELLAEEILRRLTPGTVLPLLSQLERLQDPATHPLGRRLLHGIAAHEMLRWALEELPWSLAEDPARLTAARNRRPVRIGDVLPTAGHRRYRELLSQEEITGPIEICREEREWLGRLDPAALTPALHRYLGRPTRGVLDALRNREPTNDEADQVAFWAVALGSWDPPETLDLALTSRGRMGPRFVREPLRERMAGFTQWSLPAALVAWHHGLREEVEPHLRGLLARDGIRPHDLITLGLRQQGFELLEATLQVVRDLAGGLTAARAHEEEAQLDVATTRLLLDLLGWSAGRPWPEDRAAPEIRVPRFQAGNLATLEFLEAELVELLPASTLVDDPELTARLRWRAAEAWRGRHRRLHPAPMGPGMTLPPIQFEFAFERGRKDWEADAIADLRSGDPERALAAASALWARGTGTARHLVRALTAEPPVPQAHVLVRALTRFPKEEWVAPMQTFVRSGRGRPALRVGCGLVLWSETGMEPDGLGAALTAYDAVPRFTAHEWSLLARFDAARERLLGAAIRSAEYAVYQPALDLLLSESAESPRVVDHLQAFLLMGTSRAHDLRVQAARRLLALGCRSGIPVLIAAEVRLSKASEAGAALVALDAAELDSVVDAAVAAGNGVLERSCQDESRSGIDGYVPWLSFGLANLGPDRPETARALLRLVTESGSAPCRAEALRALRQWPRELPAARQLAELLAWGVRTGYQLTGQRFSIELLTDGSHGHTRVNERRIHVNPLPLLRGEVAGGRILQGLIVHELGHHLFQASAPAMEVLRIAHREGLGGVLNLVADEHLERNLRARDPFYGDCLARMGAYVFQHARREVSVAALLDARGDWTLDQLIGLPMAAAREPGHVALEAGAALRHLEERGSSAVRFLRALRMGLGDRYGDPKVKEALALFGRGFRRTTTEEHLAISRRLARIFAGELRIVKALALDDLLAATMGELLGGDELSDQVRAELGRLLRESPRLGTVRVNRSADEQFDRIEEVVPLQHLVPEHLRLASQVRAPAAALRGQFLRLGIGVSREPRSVRGSRLDRPSLARGLVTRDPRILARRSPQPMADLFLALVVDCSGSMASGGKIERARLIATMVAEACRNLPGIDLRVFGFTERLLYDAGTAERCAAHALEAAGGNNDAGALWHAAQEALRSRRSARLLLMISDGLPTQCSVGALKSLVRRLDQRHRLSCAQVAVDAISDICFPDYVEVRETEAMGAVARFGEVLAGLSMKTLRRR